MAIPRLLIIEDQRKLLRSLRRGLEQEGYDVTTAENGEQGYYHATTETFDGIVLDLMLPGVDGMHILRNLRSNGLVIPVLILTARDAVEDRVGGLDAGADDYLIKPFAFAELVARLRASRPSGTPSRRSAGKIPRPPRPSPARRSIPAARLTPRRSSKSSAAKPPPRTAWSRWLFPARGGCTA